MRKKKFTIGGVVLLLFVVMCIPIILIWTWGLQQEIVDRPLLTYYSASVFGSFATFYTVILALFGNRIKSYLYSEEVEVCIDEDTFKEDVVNEDAPDVTVEKYHCDLLLKNIGMKPIKKCELRITDISYKANKTGRQRSIMPRALSYLKVPICGEAKNSLLERQSLSTTILSIIPETELGTPENNERTPLHLEILGHNLELQHARTGVWNIKYILQTSDKIIKAFEVNLEWTGQWRGRLMEMKNEVTIKIC